MSIIFDAEEYISSTVEKFIPSFGMNFAQLEINEANLEYFHRQAPITNIPTAFTGYEKPDTNVLINSKLFGLPLFSVLSNSPKSFYISRTLKSSSQCDVPVAELAYKSGNQVVTQLAIPVNHNFELDGWKPNFVHVVNVTGRKLKIVLLEFIFSVDFNGLFISSRVSDGLFNSESVILPPEKTQRININMVLEEPPEMLMSRANVDHCLVKCDFNVGSKNFEYSVKMREVQIIRGEEWGAF